MAVSLTKGQRVNLTKDAGLKKVLIGLGWDTNRYEGSKPFDLDLVMFMCGANGKVLDENHFIFYKNLKDPEGSVVHSGDNRTGEGDGDDETAKVDFAKVPANVQKIVIAVTIYNAREYEQTFGSVDNSYIRIVNDDTGSDEYGIEKYRYDLCEDFSIQTSVVFGELYRDGADWKFKPVGEGYAKELGDLCVEYGLEVE